jgi:seryl-tRNA synthetase
MYDIRWISENAKAFDKALSRRNLNDEERKNYSSQNLISIYDHRRALIRVLESWQAKRNAASKAIGQAKAKKDESQVQELMAEVADCKESISKLETEEKDTGERLNKLLEQIPNLPLDEVPDGKDEKSNVEAQRYYPKKEIKFDGFTPMQHFDLGEALGQMDFETAAKLSGARFVVLKRGLARLERALGQFMLDVHTGEPHNYTEISPPLIVRDDAMFGTAQLPKFSNDQFRTETEDDQRRQAYSTFEQDRTAVLNYVQAGIEAASKALLGQDQTIALGEVQKTIEAARKEQLQVLGFVYRPTPDRKWLIPTAEVPLTNLVRESILEEAQLPLRYTACTPCFRAEAGAAGKDTRGMIRQHQFTKVELVSITTPEQSKEEHERMLACAEEVLKKLDLHYRVMTLSAGDMGFASQKTYDIEVWLPGQNMYREISSCSICGEFQARRMNARYRTKEGRAVRHVHTLNGSGVAVGRALIAVMETYQQADGSIAVPEVLQSYMGGLKKIEK